MTFAGSPSGQAANPAVNSFEQLRAAVSGCIGIAHHVRGRIRLKLNASPEGLPMPSGADLYRFQGLLGEIEGVRSLRLNVLARSCALEYDPEVIPFEAWPEFLAGAATPAAGILEALLRNKHRDAVAEAGRTP